MFELKFALIFAIELLISLVGFLPYTPRRASFPIRMIASIGLYLAGATMIWQMMSPLPEIFIPVYCVMVSILIVPCAMISFEMNVWGGLYAVTGAYLVQNLTYCLSICVHQITGNNISFIGIMWDTYGIYMVISFFVWFILVRPEQLRMVCGKQKRPLILLALATVIMCVLLQSAFRSVQMTEETAARGTLIVEGYGILGCILALGLIGGMFERLQMESKKSTLEAMLESEQERSRITNETIEAINLKCHDLKHQLAYLEQHAKIGSEFTATVTASAIEFTAENYLENAEANEANNGKYTGVITYSADGLPEGLTIDPATGVISGVPVQAGIHPVQINAHYQKVVEVQSAGGPGGGPGGPGGGPGGPGGGPGGPGGPAPQAQISYDLGEDILFSIYRFVVSE